MHSIDPKLPASSLTAFLFGIGSSLIVISIGFLYFADTSLYFGLIGFLVFTAFAAMSVKFELMHPFIWFNVPFTLYSIAGPVLYLTTGIPDRTTFSEVILFEYIAIVVFSLFVGCRTVSYKDVNFDKFANIVRGNKIFFLFSIILSIILFSAILRSGMTSKMDKNVTFSPILMIGFAFYFSNISMCIFMIRDYTLGNKRRALISIMFYSFFLGGVLLIAGERGPIYRFAIVALLSYHIYLKKIPIRYLIFIAIVAMYLQGLLGGFKMAFITNEIGVDVDYSLNYETIVRNIFGSEMGTPSNNLALIIEQIPGHVPFLMGQSFWWDIQRAFVPGFLFSRDVSSSTADWFTKTFFEEWWLKGGGAGFSIVGLGYVNFGIVGIIGLFAILGAAIRKLYYMSAKTIVSCVFYINFIPIFIYTIRSDLSVPTAQGIKHTLIPLLIMYVLGHVVNRMSSYQATGKIVGAPVKRCVKRIRRRPPFSLLCRARH